MVGDTHPNSVEVTSAILDNEAAAGQSRFCWEERLSNRISLSYLLLSCNHLRNRKLFESLNRSIWRGFQRSGQAAGREAGREGGRQAGSLRLSWHVPRRKRRAGTTKSNLKWVLFALFCRTHCTTSSVCGVPWPVRAENPVSTFKVHLTLPDQLLFPLKSDGGRKVWTLYVIHVRIDYLFCAATTIFRLSFKD